MILVLGFAAVAVTTFRLAPEWLPIIIGVLGLSFAVRFVFGSEPAIDRTLLIVIGLVFGAVGTAITWPLRRRGHQVDVPASVRPLLTRSPLSRPQ